MQSDECRSDAATLIEMSGPIPAGSPGVTTIGRLASDFDKGIFSDFADPIIHFFLKGLVTQIVFDLIAFEHVAEVFDALTSNFKKVKSKITLKNWTHNTLLGPSHHRCKRRDELAACVPTEIAAAQC